MPVYILEQTFKKTMNRSRSTNKNHKLNNLQSGPCHSLSVFVYPSDALEHVKDPDATLFKCPDTNLSDLTDKQSVLDLVDLNRGTVNEMSVGHILNQIKQRG